MAAGRQVRLVAEHPVLLPHDEVRNAGFDGALTSRAHVGLRGRTRADRLHRERAPTPDFGPGPSAQQATKVILIGILRARTTARTVAP